MLADFESCEESEIALFIVYALHARHNNIVVSHDELKVMLALLASLIAIVKEQLDFKVISRVVEDHFGAPTFCADH